jgi:hypothetical protein
MTEETWSSIYFFKVSDIDGRGRGGRGGWRDREPFASNSLKDG